MQNEERPLHMTTARVIDALSFLVPQIYLTLTSILQGIALVALISNTRYFLKFDMATIFNSFLANNFYLPHIASLLIIVASWNQTTAATYLVNIPINSTTTLMRFLFCIAEVIAFTNVNSVGLWLTFIGIYLLIGYTIRRQNRRFTSRSLTLPVPSFQKRLYGRFIAWQLLTVGLITILLGWLRTDGFSAFLYSVSINSKSLVLFDVIVPGFITLAMIMLIRSDDRTYSKILDESLQNTLYTVSPSGVIAERTDQKD
jgi:hypothetical protein